MPTAEKMLSGDIFEQSNIVKFADYRPSVNGVEDLILCDGTKITGEQLEDAARKFIQMRINKVISA